MAYILLQYAYFIVFMTFYVGQGDGRLKKTTKDTLKHDLKLYKKMIDNINRELVTFYEEYPNDPLIDYYQEELYTLQEHSRDNKRRKIKDNNVNDNINGLKIIEKFENHDILSTQNENTKDVTHNISFYDQGFIWPKFEDILLAMGKKYDWKNDRWIKLKSNVKDGIKKDGYLLKSVGFHEKHKFTYRIVKLNRTKSKRNIVIAVTAVR